MMEKSEVLDLIESCYPHREAFERVYVPATQSIGDLTYLAAYNVYENIKQAILATEKEKDDEEGEWVRIGDNAIECSKCGEYFLRQGSLGFGGFILSKFAYCPFCGRAMKVRKP